MAYDEKLVSRLRSELGQRKGISEKKMFGGLTFMVDGKMCLGVLNDDLMARIDPEVYEASLRKNGCRGMTFTGRPMKGFVFISPEGTGNKKDLNYWIDLAFDFNKRAKKSKKK
ncbi:MAG: TfoX/Sxy family protein [Nitrospirae bacterium]|nr:TfoX/Sxy family protein [Nitrospirota bacterium]MBI3594164.1 TfoX/Sxy family protein [Nitrospirota bacterium]